MGRSHSHGGPRVVLRSRMVTGIGVGPMTMHWCGAHDHVGALALAQFSFRKSSTKAKEASVRQRSRSHSHGGVGFVLGSRMVTGIGVVVYELQKALRGADRKGDEQGRAGQAASAWPTGHF